MRDRLFLFIFLCSLLFNTKGQNPFHKKIEIFNQPSNTISLTQLATAIAIQSNEEQNFRLTVGDDELIVPRDPDADGYTYFISLHQPISKFDIVSDGLSYSLHIIHSGEPPEDVQTKARSLEIVDCTEPLPTISQEEWRTGLPSPNYTRSFHQVNHNIIHHSAGSNTNTNYTQVVRDIYLYHTEVNGWSDIGYNYLIAQDGTVYDGRDPADGSQDEVRGAHFCGSNTGTLGICLLGNFETAVPSSAAFSSLTSMLTYQLLLQNNDPFDTHDHPLGRLGSIAGHRDGCATLCPGENVFNMLEESKIVLAIRIEECNPTISLGIKVDNPLVKVGDPVSFSAVGSFQEFNWSIEGAFPSNPKGRTVEVSFGVPGSYDVELIGRNQQNRDTLLYHDFIRVSRLENTPIIFPNPVAQDKILNIDSKDEVQEITIYDVVGNLILKDITNQIDLMAVSSGLYFVEVKSANQFYKYRFIIP